MMTNFKICTHKNSQNASTGDVLEYPFKLFRSNISLPRWLKELLAMKSVIYGVVECSFTFSWVGGCHSLDRTRLQLWKIFCEARLTWRVMIGRVWVLRQRNLCRLCLHMIQVQQINLLYFKTPGQRRHNYWRTNGSIVLLAINKWHRSHCRTWSRFAWSSGFRRRF
jgi:hypothetical protein